MNDLPPQEFDQVIAEAIERCVVEARTSGLAGQALRAFARSRVVKTFGPAWEDARRWIIKRSYEHAERRLMTHRFSRPTSPAVLSFAEDGAGGDVEGSLADVIVQRVSGGSS